MKQQATAHLSRNKNRVKSYGESVYLNDLDTFEIELFNGYTTEVLAKIWINEEPISHSGLVLKPGQRYFLERFIDSNNKFKFTTYTVDESEATKQAIKNNGKVRVEFYQKRQLANQPIISWEPWNGTNPPNNWWTTPYWSGTTPYLTGVLNTTGLNSINVNYNQSYETGRIEMGESSEQVFESIQMEFNSWASDSVTWQILPTSQRPVEVGQLRNYCGSCGTRIRKQGWKFCPSCGNQLD
jgi:hypothetical protein